MRPKIPFFILILIAFGNVILVAIYLEERDSLPKSTVLTKVTSPDGTTTNVQNMTHIQHTTHIKNTTPQVLRIERKKVQKVHRYRSPRLHQRKPELYVRRHPQAILLGCAKAGTSTLKAFLQEHPNIVSHRQAELHYYHKNMTQQMERSHFMQMPYSWPNQTTFEVTTGYFRGHLAMEQLTTKYPDMKYCVIVRDPISRMMSSYMQGKSTNSLPPEVKKKGFEACLAENGSILASYGAIQSSIYSEPLAMWLKVVPRERMHIIDGDAFAKNPVPELQLLEKFLELPPYFTQDKFIYSKQKHFYCLRNKNGSPHCMSGSKGRKHEKVSNTTIDKLCDFFRPYNKVFFNLTGRQFDWRKCYV